jgi:hypothetical protein
MLGTSGMLGNAANKFKTVGAAAVSRTPDLLALAPADSSILRERRRAGWPRSAPACSARPACPRRPQPPTLTTPTNPPNRRQVMADKDNRRMLSVVGGMVVVLLGVYYLLFKR